jgi:hypothetical protein
VLGNPLVLHCNSTVAAAGGERPITGNARI